MFYILILINLMSLSLIYFLIKKNFVQKKNKEVFIHDIKASLTTVDLIIESLKESMSVNNEKCLLCEDLPKLLNILDESRKSILRSIRRE